MQPAITLPDHLKRAANEYPQLGILFVGEDGASGFLSYPELLQESLLVAGGLRKMGLQQGDKAIIAAESNRETVLLLWGCFLGGIIPTILQPPVSFTELNPAAAKIRNVFHQLGLPLVFLSRKAQSTDPQLTEKIRYYQDILHLPLQDECKPDPDDLAFIQFSSGSTGDPKGIMLSHRNLHSNSTDIMNGLELQPEDQVGNWMPLYHDMGLIGYHLTPLFRSSNQYLIETIDFVKNPGLWLDIISKYRITVTGSPNFGQALVLRYLKRKSGNRDWDLSPVKALLNGAEPISVRIMNEFMSSLAEFGLKNEAMMPVYGMAEATLAITFSPMRERPLITSFNSEQLDIHSMAEKAKEGKGHQNRSLVSVGTPLPGFRIRIVDENGADLPEKKVGQILVAGTAVTKGYYQQPDATRTTFADSWLHTGDMGFIFEGNLYISGRLKDIIFMNGRNHFAHDLENLACTLEDISYGKVIIGGISDPKTGKEKVLVFLAGVPESAAEEKLHSLRTLFREKMGIHLDELTLIRSNDIPKTSSGKIQRHKLIQRYQQDGFKENRYR